MTNFRRSPNTPFVSGLSRRRALQVMGGGLIAAPAALGMASASASRLQSSGEAQKLTVSVGRQPWAAGNSVVTQYMIDNELFEQAAAEVGYELTVDYRDYPTAQPQVEAMIANDLDFGMWGNTPIIRAIAAKQPVTILNLGEGHLRFVLATREDRGVRSIEDLQGKTVGALLGGDPYNVLSQMLLYTLGSGDPADFDITVVNTPTQAQAASVPRGMDASVTNHTSFLKAAADAGTVGVANSFGYTEDYYKGPAGEGGGILIESVKDSPFYPDGFYMHRSLWVAHDSILEEHPDVAVSFLVAQQRAVDELKSVDAADMSEMVKEYWELSAEQGAKLVDDELLFLRDWVWLTEGDAQSVVETSKFMVAGGLIEEPLSWEQLSGNIEKSAPLAAKAYERAGNTPPLEEFTNPDASDIRGLPSWELDQWTPDE